MSGEPPTRNDAAQIRFALHGKCSEEVIRRGESEPCDKTAVALRLDPEEGKPYPVCGHHARADMVPLGEIVEAVRRG